MPENVLSAAGAGWEITACDSLHPSPHQLDNTQVVLIAPSRASQFGPKHLSDLLDRIDRSGAVAVVLLEPGSIMTNQLSHRMGQFIIADADSPAGELSARIESALALQPVIASLRSDMATVRHFGSGAAGNSEELDEEMRLAAKLQRDFLPRILPAIGPVRFGALFRPAGWVSGDIYDVFRLDETHIGFYVADVVGHGMPAALLTMFIKKALQTKRIDKDRYEIIPPGEALTGLNADICERDLSSCQFCTAAYGIIDTQTLILRYARGGHPCPILLDSNSSLQKLDADGALLGIFPNETFGQGEIQLHPGNRLVVFSDGAEDILSEDNVSNSAGLLSILQSLHSLTSDELMLNLAMRIDENRRVEKIDDDVTVLTMDIVDS